MQELHRDQVNTSATEQKARKQDCQARLAPRQYVGLEGKTGPSEPPRRHVSFEDIHMVTLDKSSQAVHVSKRHGSNYAGLSNQEVQTPPHAVRWNDPDASQRPPKASCGNGAMRALIGAIGFARH